MTVKHVQKAGLYRTQSHFDGFSPAFLGSKREGFVDENFIENGKILKSINKQTSV
jgi:hypothetical protein